MRRRCSRCAKWGRRVRVAVSCAIISAAVSRRPDFIAASLADKAEARIGDAGHFLLVPHLMLALAATERDEAAARFLAALGELAAERESWTAPAIADVVIPICEAALAHRRGEHARVVDLLSPRQDRIRLLGGSNAQRDLFFQMLADSAMHTGRRDLVATLVPPTERAGYATAARWLM